MGVSVYEKTNSLGHIEKHVVKEYQLPFIKIYRETITDEQNKKQTVKKEVRLMAVIKTVEPVFINRAIKNGIDLIGENKVNCTFTVFFV